jgi:hypothetical protein
MREVEDAYGVRPVQVDQTLEPDRAIHHRDDRPRAGHALPEVDAALDTLRQARDALLAVDLVPLAQDEALPPAPLVRPRATELRRRAWA